MISLIWILFVVFSNQQYQRLSYSYYGPDNVNKKQRDQDNIKKHQSEVDESVRL